MAKLKKTSSRVVVSRGREATPAVRAAAARVRVAADQKMGYKTPEWIVELADEPVKLSAAS